MGTKKSGRNCPNYNPYELFKDKDTQPITFSPESMAKFGYSAAEIKSLKDYKSVDECVEDCRKNGNKVVLYGNGSDDTIIS
ncbi:MAG: hypothetical protein IJ575_11805 [Selenomonadaceae bacterium]|nr:hypothetical protein [Selenomonadaceae bacterium]